MQHYFSAAISMGVKEKRKCEQCVCFFSSNTNTNTNTNTNSIQDITFIDLCKNCKYIVYVYVKCINWCMFCAMRKLYSARISAGQCIKIDGELAPPARLSSYLYFLSVFLETVIKCTLDMLVSVCR